MSRRKRRSFTTEEKAAAVALVRSGDRSVYQAARDLDLTETALRRWVKQAEADEAGGTSETLSSDQLSELRRLRQENRELKKDVDFLKRAAAFFARESS